MACLISWTSLQAHKTEGRTFLRGGSSKVSLEEIELAVFMTEGREKTECYLGIPTSKIFEVCVCVCVSHPGSKGFPRSHLSTVTEAGGRWGFVQSATNEDAARFL